MIKKLHVKHRHRYNNEEAVLYNGEVTFNIYDDYEELLYKENDGAKVKVHLYEDHMKIIRNGEIISNLKFVVDKKTKNILMTPYGDLEIEIYTYEYHKEHDKIIVEYDVLSSSEEKDGYRIEFSIEEERSEFN
ncbi:uncharacterized beta-barrel protein YwiB (DUF1934 family) [Breznakia sp. PF5-3]|uniref:DUF1934 domain-containing protein n=1 Tax=unclassified Breznakia TaxID=2623764 RepID=UPI002405A7EF|nr:MULTISPECIES: DUF1934 domain-containing protein [unclassified Breznakia]MDL2276044.1 DUF1934 domain-containing protein [Breznakia sp. OttesenSCG-928-G09]MDF9824313.1 uncharacterized beta-barrel protein YwiB (DUF1934 family) [Breznakia sp. PM6-1]MDF9835096.1 uncharacterized beta-barrel protein YwiB (DUF1934 family) [Breznakia sp. PF5-3]MDF9838468.1 uncharacterized beta-barrel protein YwiB (DUF1934 family) [Breznakia sp. PFB2-8]MDF9860526.1 uncharacterized beta-barrel protein YwiB (DUF1934 fa